VHPSKPAIKWNQRPWQFYGLTQACVQLRAEYRPLWMRALEVRLTFVTLPKFEDVFLPKGTQQQHAPRLIQVSWEHGSDNYRGRNQLKPLLMLRARFPTLRFEFVPFDVAELKLMPGEKPCEECADMMIRYGYDSDPDCQCDDPDMSYAEWVELEEDRMCYTKIIEGFLANDNGIWHKAILDQNITTDCSFPSKTYLQFRITCKDTFCQSVSNFQDAWNLLKEWGILDLPGRNQMDIVLAFEETEKMVLDGFEVANSLVREFRVPRARLPNTGG
jgi:hypothetical protein